jgi:hypothetical protein
VLRNVFRKKEREQTEISGASDEFMELSCWLHNNDDILLLIVTVILSAVAATASGGNVSTGIEHMILISSIR